MHLKALFIHLYVSFLFVLQRVSERVGGAEGTKLDVDFTEMEKARPNSHCSSYYHCCYYYYFSIV